jgi:hypothetical protein
MRKMIKVVSLLGLLAMASVFTGCASMNAAIEDAAKSTSDFLSKGDGALESMQKLGKCSGNPNDPNCRLSPKK